MKIFFKMIIACLLFIGLDKLIRTQTDGFRMEKTMGVYPPHEEWDVTNAKPVEEVLHQNFRFLGSGVQCYAFLGEDNETVLKVFKHHHFGPTTTQLKSLPLPRFLNGWRESILKKRELRMRNIFTSALIARKELERQTGVFHLNLNPTEHAYPTVTIYDKIKIAHEMDLNKTPFLLQKKADLFFSYLNTHKEEVKPVIDSLIACIRNRTQKGISNSDGSAHKNFGILHGTVVEIDIGSFVENPSVQNSLYSKRELFYQTLEVKDWVKQNVPEFSDYFEQTLLEAIRT